MNKNLLFCIAAFLFAQIASASTTGDYRTQASGNWHSAATWQVYDATHHWVTATVPPDYTNGIITIIAGDSITVTDTTYADQVVVNTHGILHVVSNVFYLKNGTGTDLLVSGKLIIDAIARVDNDPVLGNCTVDYRGDTLIQNGGFQIAQTFDGPNPQLILGSGFNADLTINNAGNVTLAGSESYNGATFKKGRIIATGTFVMTQYRHVFSGAGSTRFIDGNVALITYDNTALSFTLPLGSSGHYVPVLFNVQKNNALQTDYVLSVKDGAPPAATLPATLDRVSAIRYLSVSTDQPGTITSSSLTIGYDATDLVADPVRLRIAQAVGSNWVNLGGKGASGKIMSSVNFTTFGNFVLADAVPGMLMLDHTISSGNLSLSDTYKVGLSGDGKLKLPLSATSNNPLSLTLFDGNGTTVLATLSVGANSTDSIVKDGLGKGPYYAKITPTNLSAIYTYTLGDSLFVPAQASDAELNDTKSTARNFILNTSTTGHIGYYYNNHRDTFDWHKIVTMSVGTLTLTLSSNNSNSVHLTLYSGNGTTVVNTLTASGNSTNVLTLPALAKGTYYAVITSLDNTKFEPYTLTNGFTSPFSAGQVTEDYLTTGGKTGVTDAVVYPNPAPRQFRVQLNGNLKPGSSVAMALKDINGRIVWSSTKTNALGVNSLQVDVSKLPAGVYFLQIVDENKNEITKKIIVSR